MITKKDWLMAKMNYESLLVNGEMTKEVQELALEHCKKKISEFPDDDPMPEEVKDIVKAVK